MDRAWVRCWDGPKTLRRLAEPNDAVQVRLVAELIHLPLRDHLPKHILLWDVIRKIRGSLASIVRTEELLSCFVCSVMGGYDSNQVGEAVRAVSVETNAPLRK